MLLRDFAFALLTISAVILGFSAFWEGLAVNPQYNVTAPSSDLIKIYNQTGNAMSISSSLQNNQTGIGAMLQNIPILGNFASVLIAGTQVLSVFLQLPDIFMTMLNSMGSIIPGMPSWFIGILATAVAIAVIMAIIGQSVVKGRV